MILITMNNNIFSNPDNLRHNVNSLLIETSKNIILPKYKSLKNNEIKTKDSSNDYVTIADEEAEKFLTKNLKNILPLSHVIGEESVYSNKDILKKLDEKEPVWIIDPIDGTSNFISGIDKFYIIIALVINNNTIMGWIHNPISNETAWGYKGYGTWIDNKKISIEKNNKKLIDNKAAIYHKSLIDYKNKFKYIKYNGSAAHEYISLIKNKIQISCFSRLLPWDHAAGILLHKEAGGYSALLNSREYFPNSKNPGGILSTPTSDIWNSVRSLMKNNS